MQILHPLSIVCSAFALLGAALAAPAVSAADAPPADSTGKLYHIVSFKFKPATTPEQMEEVSKALLALKDKIPGIVSVSWGTNVSPENRNKGFTHVYVLAFTSEKDRDGYLVHPEHKAFGKLAGPFFDDVLVIDYWEKK